MATSSLPNEKPFAIEIRDNYTPPSQNSKKDKSHPILKISKGEWGWAYKSTGKDGWYLCEIKPGTRAAEIGWISKDFMNLGLMKADELQIDDPGARKRPGPTPAQLAKADTVLENAVEELWINIRANRAMLEHEIPRVQQESRINDLLFGPQPLEYAKVINNAIRKDENKRFRSVARSGNFDPLELAEKLPNMLKTKKYPQLPGIYGRMYRDLEDVDKYWTFKHQDFKPTTGGYFGQVGEPSRWAKRIEKYNRDLAANQTQHAKLANKMEGPDEDIAMFSGILFDPKDPQVVQLGLSKVLYATELTLVCLFRTWHPILLGPDHNLSQTATHYDAFRAAKAFKAITDVVTQLTGWNPTQLVGCNWETPMVIGNYDWQTIWCTWHDPQKELTVFRCRRRLIITSYLQGKMKGKLKSAYIRLSDRILLHVNLDLIKAAGFEGLRGKAVNVVVEFNDSKDHESMYCRFPRIGPNPAYEILRRMAIKIEYVDDDKQWWAGLVNRSHIWTTQSDVDAAMGANYKIPDLYRSALGIASSLLCMKYTGAPAWLPQYTLGQITIRRFVYDHLRQKISVEGPAASIRPWVPDRTMAQNKALIQAEVDQKHWNTSVGTRPANLPKGRKNCDVCVSQSATDGEYRSLGLTTNIQLHATQLIGTVLQKIDEPFDPDAQEEEKEDENEDDE